MNCTEARGMLLGLHDAGGAPQRELAGHLAACPRCAAFARRLEGLGADLRAALDASAAGLPQPDVRAIVARGEQERQRATLAARRRSRLVAAAAAAVLAGAGIAGGVRGWLAHRERLMVASNVSGFVEELFADPLLAESGHPADDAVPSLREWLEGPAVPSLP